MFLASPYGYTVVFDNGYEISVYFSKDHVCDNRVEQDNHPMKERGITASSNNAEISVWDPSGLEVAKYSFQSAERFLKLCNEYGGKT